MATSPNQSFVYEFLYRGSQEGVQGAHVVRGIEVEDPFTNQSGIRYSSPEEVSMDNQELLAPILGEITTQTLVENSALKNRILDLEFQLEQLQQKVNDYEQVSSVES